MTVFKRYNLVNRLKQTKLILFFTQDVSLQTWDRVGMLEREVAIYRRLLPHLGGIAFLTYGDRSDLSYAPRLGGIEILCNLWGLPAKIYAQVASLLHWRHLWRADIYKTNQTEGVAAALLAKRIFRKKMISRCGFMWSLYLSQPYCDQTLSRCTRAALRRERVAITSADHVVVTTSLMRQYAMKQYDIADCNIHVIPNYVQTDVFAPSGQNRQSRQRIIFVGRFVPQKNLFGLLEAICGLEMELIMIGDGPLRPQLEDRATCDGLRVRFLGNKPNRELPEFFKEADLFVLPSHWEGHPKALLEAMACGLPVVGVNAQGTRELIQHRKTGFLCGSSPNEIRAAIQEVMGDEDLRKRMGRMAREAMVNHFSIDNILKLELALLGNLVNGR
jgi:glycosyltransferase involved in cell wall biosynthesis